MKERRPSVGFMSHRTAKGYEIYNIAVNLDELSAEDLVKNQKGGRIINLICFLDESKKASPINVDASRIEYLRSREVEEPEI